MENGPNGNFSHAAYVRWNSRRVQLCTPSDRMLAEAFLRPSGFWSVRSFTPEGHAHLELQFDYTEADLLRHLLTAAEMAAGTQQ